MPNVKKKKKKLRRMYMVPYMSGTEARSHNITCAQDVKGVTCVGESILHVL